MLLILVQSFQQHWDAGFFIAFDEGVYKYAPSVYIPRKPHPNGMMNWVAVTISTKTGLPFVIDMEPHIQFPQISCFIADAAVGSFDLMKEITDAGMFAIISMPKKSKKWLWELLARCTKDGHWEEQPREQSQGLI